MNNHKKDKFKEDCIFCKIAQREIPSSGIFWEDDYHMAFLSINPNTEGFSVLIPKKHYPSDVMKMDHEALCSLMIASKKVSRKLEQAFDDVGRIGVIMEGTGVDHAHIKLIPMHGTVELKNGGFKHFETSSDKRVWFDSYQGFLSSESGDLVEGEILLRLVEKIRKNE